MTKAQFNKEMDDLVVVCVAVMDKYQQLLACDDNEEAGKVAIEEFKTAIANFQRKCFRLTPEIKRLSKEEPEYNVLLEKLIETIKLLSH